jgi:hypothetical protein
LAVKQDTPEPASKTLQASSCTIGLVMENPEKEKSGKIRKWAKMDRQGKWVSLLLFSSSQRPEARVLALLGVLAGREEGGRQISTVMKAAKTVPYRQL